MMDSCRAERFIGVSLERGLEGARCETRGAEEARCERSKKGPRRLAVKHWIWAGEDKV